MWYDKRATFIPSMKRRPAFFRVFPPASWAILIASGLVLAIFGDKIIRGFFWGIACGGEVIVKHLVGS